ncbi:TPA: triphosphoribosyl-dephospho-CoA synthase, partial [Burkholderia aenigmatica]|nr:triphosphoribosyl-dephospho-CoA synthase [Burkholderia aenigmatica]
VARRLSPGGAADLLAMSVFVDALEADGEAR